MKKLYLTHSQVTTLESALNSYLKNLREKLPTLTLGDVRDLVEGVVQQGEMILKELKKEAPHDRG